MNELQIFKYQSNEIRTFVDEKGTPWWVAKDIAEVLGYVWKTNLTYNVPEEWRGTKRISTLGGEQEMLCLSEQGLYFFLARSDKPSALPFQKWVAGDVIPSIRRTGSYSREISRKELAMLVIQAEEDKEKLLLENSSMKPKVEFFDAVTGSRSAIDIGRVAKVLNFRNMGRNSLFAFLRDQGVLMKDNIPYQEYIDRGYFRIIEQKYNTPEGETRISIKTVVFQRGVDYIRKLLIHKGFESQHMHMVGVR